MNYFSHYSQNDILSYISFREGEHKLGQSIEILNNFDSLTQSNARFVLIGIPEDVGVRANKGVGGADTSWQAFLKSFLNIQETSFLSGKDFILAGKFSINLLKEEIQIDRLREAVAQIDSIVFPVIQQIISAGKIPIVIGGGHNNVYPILKGASLALKQPVNVVNLDAHSDFRRKEGRHSGNGFRYAYEEKYLEKYALLGLHEAYNHPDILKELNENPDFLCILREDIFMRQKISWEEAIQRVLGHIDNQKFGVELDLDCIENTLSSAMTPIGISASLAMNFLYKAGQDNQSLYLHLPEGVSEREDGLKNTLTGKLLSYLVQSFAKGVLERS